MTTAGLVSAALLLVAAALLVVEQHTQGRTFGFLGEPRVNVHELNLALGLTAPSCGSTADPSSANSPASG